MTDIAHTEQVTIKRRWYSSGPEITVSISCEPTASAGIKLGLAVRVAFGSGAVLRGAVLSGAVLSDAVLSGAVLSDADLRGAVLRGAVLRGAVLRDADLRDADLSDADLRDADLSDADLRDADLSDADLRDADLSDADLRDADLSGAVLSDADLSGADLRDAVLSGAVLRSIKADFWMILCMARREVPALINALRSGKVNGSTYHGPCACLVGSLENAGAKDLPHVASSPAELWFAPIRPGQLPGGDSEGSFRARTALDWALEFCAVSGIDPDSSAAAQAEAA